MFNKKLVAAKCFNDTNQSINTSIAPFKYPYSENNDNTLVQQNEFWNSISDVNYSIIAQLSSLLEWSKLENSLTISDHIYQSTHSYHLTHFHLDQFSEFPDRLDMSCEVSSPLQV